MNSKVTKLLFIHMHSEDTTPQSNIDRTCTRNSNTIPEGSEAIETGTHSHKKVTQIRTPPQAIAQIVTPLSPPPSIIWGTIEYQKLNSYLRCLGRSTTLGPIRGTLRSSLRPHQGSRVSQSVAVTRQQFLLA